MRLIVMTLAVVSALAGALIAGSTPAADTDTDATDIALFI